MLFSTLGFANKHSLYCKQSLLPVASHMLSISLIIFFSVVLFMYWFRYSCLLILQNRASYNVQKTSGAVLNLSSAQERLHREQSGVEALDQLQRDLVNDYRILCFLLRCSTENGVAPIDRRMLMMDYWIMRAWYCAARRIAPPQARMALVEISNIVSYFSYSVGRTSAQCPR